MMKQRPQLNFFASLVKGNKTEQHLNIDIQRNVELILNSLPPLVESGEKYPLCRSSNLFYGTVSVLFHGQRDRLAKMLAKSIEKYEPRLRDIRVEVYREQRDGDQIRFGIFGTIYSDSEPQDLFLGGNLDVKGQWIALTESEIG